MREPTRAEHRALLQRRLTQTDVVQQQALIEFDLLLGRARLGGDLLVQVGVVVKRRRRVVGVGQRALQRRNELRHLDARLGGRRVGVEQLQRQRVERRVHRHGQRGDVALVERVERVEQRQRRLPAVEEVAEATRRRAVRERGARGERQLKRAPAVRQVVERERAVERRHVVLDDDAAAVQVGGAPRRVGVHAVRLENGRPRVRLTRHRLDNRRRRRRRRRPSGGCLCAVERRPRCVRVLRRLFEQSDAVGELQRVVVRRCVVLRVAQALHAREVRRHVVAVEQHPLGEEATRRVDAREQRAVGAHDKRVGAAACEVAKLHAERDEVARPRVAGVFARRQRLVPHIVGRQSVDETVEHRFDARRHRARRW